MSKATLTEGVKIPISEAMFDRMKAAPNRVLQHSPGPNPLA